MSEKSSSEFASLFSIRTIDYSIESLDYLVEETPNISEKKEPPPSEPSPDLDPTLRFEHETLLGEGAYGEVWRVQDNFVKRKVAIKMLTNPLEHVVHDCHKEASLGARVSHPGTPTIYDIGRDEDGRFRVIMEYMEGEGLDKIIRRLQKGVRATHAEFSFQARAQLLLQLLRVLVSSHKEGIVHSDIKPENILIGPSKELFLCDWGLAFEPKINPRTRICGTPAFMAPEQVTLQNISFPSDLFGVASLAYILMSLESWHVFEGDLKAYLIEKKTHKPNRIDMIHNVHQGRVPSEYRDWIHKGLSRDPSQRHSNAEEMLNELEQIISGNICSTCPRTLVKHWGYRYFQFMDRYPEPVLAGTGIAFILVIAALMFLGKTLF